MSRKKKQKDVSSVPEGLSKPSISSGECLKDVRSVIFGVDHQKRVESFVKKSLRRSSLRWPERNEAKKAARIERGFYRCADCGEKFGPKEGNLDHIEPVQPVGLKIDLITWIYRLLCPLSNWQWICRNCHAGKTLAENMLRDVRKKALTKKKK